MANKPGQRQAISQGVCGQATALFHETLQLWLKLSDRLLASNDLEIMHEAEIERAADKLIRYLRTSSSSR